MARSHLVLNLSANHIANPFRVRRPQVVGTTLTQILRGELLCAHRTKWCNQTLQTNHVLLGPPDKACNRFVHVPCLWACVEPEVTVGPSVLQQNCFALSTRFHSTALYRTCDALGVKCYPPFTGPGPGRAISEFRVVIQHPRLAQFPAQLPIMAGRHECSNIGAKSIDAPCEHSNHNEHLRKSYDG